MNNYKTIWTESDFDVMGWHDSKIYSIQWNEENFELIFDIDYIFEWINDGDSFRFVVCPVTLTFENVWDLKIEVEPRGEIQINEISRMNPNRPKNAEFINKEMEWQWNIDLFYGDITFKSVGYTHINRKEPVEQKSQSLSLSERKDLQNYLESMKVKDANPFLIFKS